MGDPARILLADDHPLVARALSGLFSREDDLEVVGHVTDLAELWGAIADTAPDVLILDIGMPGGNAMDALHRMKNRHADVRVLVLSGFPEEEFVARMIEAGSSGYVQKLAEPATLVDAVRKVAQGDMYVSERGALALARSAAGRGPDHESLSDREIQVLRLLGEGKSVSQIADTLFLSPKTISTYWARLMETATRSSRRLGSGAVALRGTRAGHGSRLAPLLGQAPRRVAPDDGPLGARVGVDLHEPSGRTDSAVAHDSSYWWHRGPVSGDENGDDRSIQWPRSGHPEGGLP